MSNNNKYPCQKLPLFTFYFLSKWHLNAKKIWTFEILRAFSSIIDVMFDYILILSLTSLNSQNIVEQDIKQQTNTQTKESAYYYSIPLLHLEY